MKLRLAASALMATGPVLLSVAAAMLFGLAIGLAVAGVSATAAGFLLLPTSTSGADDR